MNESTVMDAMALLDSALVAWHVRTTVGLAAVLLAGLALRSCKARTRHRMLAWGLLAAVLLPSAAAVAPNAWGLPMGTRPQVETIDSAVTLTTALPEPTLLEAEAATATVSETSDFDVGTVLLMVWMAGASACLLGVGAAAVGSLSLRTGAGPVSPATRAVFEELQAHAGTSARLGLTARVHGPIVVGAFAPTVLLPLQANAWSEVRLRAVLAHELGHVAQGDHRWFPLAYAVRGLLWSNPLAWLVARSFFRAAEFSADEAAIAGTMKAPSYAAQLLSLASNGMSAPTPMLAAAALGSPDVGTRIRRLLSTPPAVAQLRRVVPVTMGLLGAATCIVLARPATVIPTDTAGTTVSPSSARNLLPVPEQAHRVSLRAGRLIVTANNGETWSQEPGTELQRRGHLLQDMHTFLRPRVDAPAQLVVDADRSVSFAALVDVLYTAGKAGVASYYLQVPTPQGPRVLSVSPPRFSPTPQRLQASPDDRTQPALRVRVIVGEDTLHLSTRPSQTDPPRYEDPGLSCQTDARSSAGPQRTAADLCTATDGAPIQISYSGLQDTSYGALTDSIISMLPPCGATQLIEAEGRTLEPADEPSCDDALANVRVPRVR